LNNLHPTSHCRQPTTDKTAHHFPYSAQLIASKMTGRPSVHWGNIGAETAKSAVAKLEKGKRMEMTPFPFDNVAIAEEDLTAVKEEVEQVRKARLLEFQGTDTCAENERPGHSLEQSQRDHNLGQSECDKGVFWERPRQ
jgi:hypothetical protein